MNIQPLVNPNKLYRNKDVGVIEGYWNEDDNPFEIICPSQLQPILIWVLNNLMVKKVTLTQSKSCDTRSAEHKVTENELFLNSMQHIQDVQNAISWMKARLQEVSERHDYTKIENIKEFYNNFKFIQDGNIAEFKKLNWFQEYHLKERHHLNDHCPEDVNLFDVMERVSDITVAGMARTGNIYDDTLSPEILTRAYKNTIKLLKEAIKVED
jgi:hypothetical protein